MLHTRYHKYIHTLIHSKEGNIHYRTRKFSLIRYFYLFAACFSRNLHHNGKIGRNTPTTTSTKVFATVTKKGDETAFLNAETSGV